MTAYRYLYADAMTDTLVGELPLEEVTYGETLNSPGSFRGRLALNASLPGGALVPGEHALYVERDGVLVWGGMLWTTDADVESNSLTLGGEGFWSLIRARRIADGLTYTAQDQTTIAAAILTNLKGKPGGDHLIVNAHTATGVLRDRTYPSHERKNAAEAIEELAAVRNGFDFRIGVRWGGSAVVREFITSYPATGRRTEWVLDVGTNAELMSLSVDATTVATTVHVKGEGEGADGKLLTISNAALLGTRPLMEDLIVYSDVTETSTLDAHARRRLDRGSSPVAIPSVVLYPGREPFVGSFVVGDQVRVRATYGALAVDDTFRITSFDATVSDEGESVALTLAPLSVFQES